MIALALAIAGVAELDQVERCRAAVHGAIETAAEICRPPAVVDLFAPSTAADRCRGALERGRKVGLSAPGLPDKARAGLVRHFDEAYRACTAPKASSEPPELDQVQLWD